MCVYVSHLCANQVRVFHCVCVCVCVCVNRDCILQGTGGSGKTLGIAIAVVSTVNE